VLDLVVRGRHRLARKRLRPIRRTQSSIRILANSTRAKKRHQRDGTVEQAHGIY
jgi:hypothetical protein